MTTMAGRAEDGRAESLRDLGVAAVVFGWITVILFGDEAGSIWEQRLYGVATWALLFGLLRREIPLVRAQVAIVVAFATAVEYTFSPTLEVYVYRLDNVPAYVPPGHGMVYLCALAIGRTCWVHRYRWPLIAATVAVGGTWSLYALLAPRHDVLGAFWFVCLLGFLVWGRSRTLYVGAFLIVSYLEILGTHLATWTWQTHDPTGLVGIGNPPSGAAGGYGWFDLAAILGAPALLRLCARLRGRSAAEHAQGDLVEQAVACEGAATVGPGTPG